MPDVSIMPSPLNLTATLLRSVAVIFLLASAAFSGNHAHAEPYIAVRAGLECSSCHVNPTGGGQRNAFGNTFAQNAMNARPGAISNAREAWTGAINRWVSVGGDFRGRMAGTRVQGDTNPPAEFEVQDVFAYLTFNLIPDRLTVHVDERVGPRGASNRQSYALIRPGGGPWYIRGGRFFLPFGLRLADDGAFIRQSTGINFTTPDTGLEFGHERARWSTRVAVTNGTAGAPEIDDGKQISAVATYLRPRWRMGISANHNSADAGNRDMAGVFAGLRSGPLVWLAELDYIRDELSGPGNRHMRAALIEANWGLAPGQNLKLTAERLYSNAPDQDTRSRNSVIWEYFPIPFVQSRVGWRRMRGTPGIAPQNRDEWFAQLHVYF